MSVAVVGGDVELRRALEAMLPGHGDLMVVPWDIPALTENPDAVGGAQRAIERGLRDSRDALAAGPARLLHLVRSAGDAPMDRSVSGFVAAFGRSLAREEAPHGVTVNSLGTRGGQIPDLRRLLAFLAGPDGGFVTGQSLGEAGRRLAAPRPVPDVAGTGRHRALVSGGAGEIGEAITRRLAQDGWDVGIGHVRPEAAIRLAGELDRPQGPHAWAVPLDITDPNAVDAALRKEPWDAVVLCGGWNRTSRFIETPPEEWARTLAVNLLGPAQLAGRFHGPRRTVVGIGSESARIGDGGRAVYAGAKAGLAAMLSAMNDPSVGFRGVTVAPGPVDTPLLRQTHGGGEAADRGIGKLARLIPLGRLGKPREIAAAVSLALEDPGGILDGEVLSVGGGITMT